MATKKIEFKPSYESTGIETLDSRKHVLVQTVVSSENVATVNVLTLVKNDGKREQNYLKAVTFTMNSEQFKEFGEALTEAQKVLTKELKAGKVARKDAPKTDITTIKGDEKYEILRKAGVSETEIARIKRADAKAETKKGDVVEPEVEEDDIFTRAFTTKAKTKK